MRHPDLSIIMVSYNTRDLLKRAIEKVFASKTQYGYEVIVVDNASHDGSAEMVETEFANRVTLIRNTDNVGFAAGNNPGMEIAKGKYVLLLNSDAFVFDTTLEESIEYMDLHPEVGIMGAQLICEDGSPQPSARQFPTLWRKMKVLSGWDARHPEMDTYYDYYQKEDEEKPIDRVVDWVPGTYFMIRKEAMDEIGLLDDRYFMYYEEVDYCLRAKQKDWLVAFNPAISVIHLGGQSSLTTKKEVSRTGTQLVDIRVNSEYDYFNKHSGKLTMLMAAMFEVGWKSMIWLKNALIRRKDSEIKRDESRLAIRLVMRKVGRELVWG